MLHITDLSWSRVPNPSSFKLGEEIDVKVLSFDKEKLRVSLGLKQIHNDPWTEIESKYSLAGFTKQKYLISLIMVVLLSLKMVLKG